MYTDLEFTAVSATAWYEKSFDVPLQPGSNSITMQMFWGWMYVDYLAVPTNILVDLNEIPPAIPSAWSLEQNFPNPFNPVTVIRYEVPELSHVRLVVFDLLGREVATLVNDRRQAGAYPVRFDGSGLASGVYVVRLQARVLRSTAGEANSFEQSRKMMLLK